jgi:hypothetical protein
MIFLDFMRAALGCAPVDAEAHPPAFYAPASRSPLSHFPPLSPPFFVPPPHNLLSKPHLVSPQQEQGQLQCYHFFSNVPGWEFLNSSRSCTELAWCPSRAQGACCVERFIYDSSYLLICWNQEVVHYTVLTGAFAQPEGCKEQEPMALDPLKPLWLEKTFCRCCADLAHDVAAVSLAGMSDVLVAGLRIGMHRLEVRTKSGMLRSGEVV